MQDFESDFLNDGFVNLGSVLDKTVCHELVKKVYETRNFGPELFIEEKQHKDNQKPTKKNPGPGINLTEKFNLDFIEKNKIIINTLNFILGIDFEIILKKFVVAAPSYWIPSWLKGKISASLAANLGPYIKEEFRDVSYFRGIDYHMDQIDFPNSNPDFITMYVYLNDTTPEMSPLHVIEKSHIYGPTKFPHFINEVNEDYVIYGLDKNNSKKLNFNFFNNNEGFCIFRSYYFPSEFSSSNYCIKISAISIFLFFKNRFIAFYSLCFYINKFRNIYKILRIKRISI